MARAATTLAPQTHPHLVGNLAPLRTEDDFELRVQGQIPSELTGAYFRIGPNPQFDPGPEYHSFMGDGMVHGFWLENGRARYRNRYVRTPRWQLEHAAKRPLFDAMGRPPSDPALAQIPRGTANTNIIQHAGKLLALQEASNPFELDGRSLASLGWLETGGRFTAHPKRDPETGELVWFAYSAGEAPLNQYIDYGVSAADGRILRRDRFAAPYCSMIHDFLVTRQHVLFPVLPLTGDLARAMSGGPAFAWEPSKGAYLGIMKRNASVDTLRWLEIDANYVFHPLNAWEDGAKIYCDVMEYPSAPLFPHVEGTVPLEHLAARLTRWTIDLADPGARVRREPLDDIDGEFPRLDERFAGLPYRHGWYAGNVGRQSTLEFDSLVHADLKTGKRTIRQLQPGEKAGEPVFVPRHASAAEGDGYILATIYSSAEDRSSLGIFQAQDIAAEPVAMLELPRRVPAGFHGNWIPA
ncbi:MAG: hypothetical protein RL701_4072 [Pseudomonadota bacterium]|jgi:carotenoid cleavage dioxygenase